MSSSQPKPDINTPSYKPNQIAENMTLSYKPKGGQKVTLQRQPKDGDPKSGKDADGFEYEPGMYSASRPGGGSGISM